MIPKKDAGTIKEAILVILAQDFPLTAKQLHLKVSKLLNRNFSYQALHKRLQEAIGKSIIVRSRKNYSLSPLFIQQIVEYSEQLKTGYLEKSLPENQKNPEFGKGPATLEPDFWAKKNSPFNAEPGPNNTPLNAKPLQQSEAA